MFNFTDSTPSSIFITKQVKTRLGEYEQSKDAITHMIESRVFRVADLHFSYRAIGIFGSQELLPEHAQDSERRWRLFTLKDLLYLEILLELKQYGVKSDRLHEIKDLFYGEHGAYATKAIACIMCLEPMSLLYFPAGRVFIFDLFHYGVFESSLQEQHTSYMSYLKINLNELLNRILWRVNLEHFPLLATTGDYIIRAMVDRLDLSPQEKEIVEIIRNRDYSKVTVRKQSKTSSYVIEAEASSESGGNALGVAIDAIKNKDYADIVVKKRDGRLVQVTTKDTFKI